MTEIVPEALCRKSNQTKETQLSTVFMLMYIVTKIIKISFDLNSEEVVSTSTQKTQIKENFYSELYQKFIHKKIIIDGLAIAILKLAVCLIVYGGFK